MREAIHEIARSAQLGDEVIERVLRFARTHLEMDVAWVSHVSGGRQVIESLDGAADLFKVAVGSSPPYELGARVAAGELPSVVNRVQDDPRTADLPVTHEMGIGAYIGVPLRRSDGEVYGMLSCLSKQSDDTLRERDAHFLALVAEVLTPSITERDRHRHRAAVLGARIQKLLDAGGPKMVYQPVRLVPSHQIVGYEALARFPIGYGGSEHWFADADEADLGRKLQLAAVTTGLRALIRLPPNACVAVNISADLAGTDALAAAVSDYDPHRVILEITENHPIADYAALRAATADLRAAGIRIAVDDAGAGYAGFQHLVELAPDIIKLDHQITHHIDTDPARRAMAVALVGFAAATNGVVLAEGIETSAELATVVDLGITLAQGYYLGRPARLPRSPAGRNRSGRSNNDTTERASHR